MSIIKFNNRYYKLIPFIVILLILIGFIIVLISSAYNLHVEQENIKNVKPEPQIFYVDKPSTTLKYKKLVISPTQIKESGITLKQLIHIGVTPQELKEAGFTPLDFKEQGIISLIRSAGFSAGDVRDDFGFSVSELSQCNFYPHELFRIGILSKELYKNKLPLHHYEMDNDNFYQAVQAGYTFQEIKDYIFKFEYNPFSQPLEKMETFAWKKLYYAYGVRLIKEAGLTLKQFSELDHSHKILHNARLEYLFLGLKRLGYTDEEIREVGLLWSSIDPLHLKTIISPVTKQPYTQDAIRGFICYYINQMKKNADPSYQQEIDNAFSSLLSTIPTLFQ